MCRKSQDGQKHLREAQKLKVLMVISGVVLIFGVKKENAPCGKSPQLCISNWVLDSCLSHSCTFLVLNNDKQIRGERVGRLTAS
nr:uncharacterized protein LOC108013036 isoform X4 [Drosophila suzukii]